ncbi:hypothetical protein [Membranihabitans marinus]|uniref:hypothetical protein n=1 Tax=Membranihabitans marinus TaxID=1227546 RepID=UPI001F1FEA80|nr:hypothetical protein [Membranihabitans marinus]
MLSRRSTVRICCRILCILVAAQWLRLHSPEPDLRALVLLATHPRSGDLGSLIDDHFWIIGTLYFIRSCSFTPKASGFGSFIQSTFTGLGCPPDNFIQSSSGQLHSVTSAQWHILYDFEGNHASAQWPRFPHPGFPTHDTEVVVPSSKVDLRPLVLRTIFSHIKDIWLLH